MADPFSIVTGAVGVVDVCAKLVTFLVQVKKGSDTIDQDLERLIGDINSLKAVCKVVRQSFEKDIPGDRNPPSKDEEATVDLWHATGNALQDCQKTLYELDLLIRKVVGENGSSTFDKTRRYFRRQSKEDELIQLWKRLNKCHHLLEILLTAINITYTRKSRETSDQSFAELASTIHGLGSKIQTQIASLEGKIDTQVSSPSEMITRSILATAKSIGQLASLNVHFMIPQSVTSTFTGRETALEDLKHAYAASALPGQPPRQKRFVIYGLGGSGKTQFCCKFAQDNRQEYDTLARKARKPD